MSVGMYARADPSPVTQNIIEIRKKILNADWIMKCDRCNDDMTLSK